MKMSVENGILYGGDIGSDEEICLHAKSLGEALMNAANRAGHRIVLIDGISGKEVSGYELKSKAIRLAQYLRQQYGIRSGDVISICSENRIEFAVAIQATIYLGGTVAPLNHSYSEDEMTHAVNLSKPKVIFVSTLNLTKVTNIAKKHSFIRQVILYDNGVDSAKLSSLLRQSQALPFDRIMESVDDSKLNDFKCEPQNMKENVAFVLCSSGTTGLPKGVMLTEYNMLVGNMHINVKRPQKLENPPSGERVVLATLPMFHAFGLCVYTTGALNPLWKYVLLPRFTEEDFLRCIQKYRATITYVVPPIILFLAKSPLVEKYDLSSLRVIFFGAAPGSTGAIEVAKRRTGVGSFRQGYGMTEGTYAFITQNDDHLTSGSVGVVLGGMYARVVDTENGKILGPNQPGEIHLKGPGVMKGYIGNEKATNETIDADGWIHTGDVGYYDEKSEWYIVDRIKELIKYKGFQVPPAEIEALLLSNPKIKDAAVIGIPDEESGEKAFAFVVKQPGVNLKEKEVIDFVAGRLSTVKHLHGGVRFIDEIPKNMTGKILRRVLREMVANLKSKL